MSGTNSVNQNSTGVSLDENFSSPELVRGTSLSADKRLLSTSIGCFLSATPDIKNSTINPCSDARNIGDLPDLECSPVEHRDPSLLFSGSRDAQSIRWNPEQIDFLNCLTNPQDIQQISTSCSDPNPGKVVEKQSNRFEACETLEEGDRSQKGESLKNEKRGHTFSCQMMTPDPLNKAKQFINDHHSCLPKPPPHWIETPIAVRARKQPLSTSIDVASNLVNCSDVSGMDVDTVSAADEPTKAQNLVHPYEMKRKPPRKGLQPNTASDCSTAPRENHDPETNVNEVTDWVVRIVSYQD